MDHVQCYVLKKRTHLFFINTLMMRIDIIVFSIDSNSLQSL